MKIAYIILLKFAQKIFFPLQTACLQILNEKKIGLSYSDSTKKGNHLSSGRKSVNGCDQRARSFCSIGDGCCSRALRVNGRSANIKAKKYVLI